mgnify:CR=1 FL=1
MTPRILRIIVSILFLLLLTACNAGVETEGNSETAVPNLLQTTTEEEHEPFVSRLADIQAAKAAWEAHDIEAYQVNLAYRPVQKNPQLLRIQVRGDDIELLKHDCMPAQNCVMINDLDLSALTIDAVLAQVEAMAEAENPEAEIFHLGHIVYHDTYDFPRLIESSQGAWTFTDFRVLEE